MNLIGRFTSNGVPKTGLFPTIDVWKLDGTQVVTSQAMIEVAAGFYYYDFTTYNEDLDYCISADGGNTLAKNDRYLSSTNETAGVGKILKIEKNKWEITANQFKIFDDDEIKVLYTYDLKNKNGVLSSRDVFSRTPL